MWGPFEYWNGVYRCLGVFTLVLNTVGRMEGVILIPKRIVFWRGVKVFGQKWVGERIKFIVRLTRRRDYEIFPPKTPLDKSKT